MIRSSLPNCVNLHSRSLGGTSPPGMEQHRGHPVSAEVPVVRLGILPVSRTTSATVGIRANRSFGDLKTAFNALGHMHSTRGFISHLHRPLLDRTALMDAGVEDDHFLVVQQDELHWTRASHGTSNHRGGLSHETADITRDFMGTRHGVFEITLFIHPGLGGRVDIQVNRLTTVTQLIEYVAAIISLPPTCVERLHDSCGSIADYGPRVCDIPGFSDWDDLLAGSSMPTGPDNSSLAPTRPGDRRPTRALDHR